MLLFHHIVENRPRYRDSYVSLGIFGACQVNENSPDRCTGARVRYSPVVFVNNALSVTIARTMDGITGALLLAPIVCGLSFFAFLIALCSYRIGFFFAAFVAGWTFLVTLVLVIIEASIFGVIRSNANSVPGVHASYGSGFWCTIAALPVLFLATCCSFAACFSDRRKERGFHFR
ncbi:hypothetical protein JCM10213_001486 [Rhodosporidiobolus nylandii]